MKSVVAIIPARSGSKAIIDKNIVELGNKPLIAHSIQTALECKLIGNVFVSTDSTQYAEIAQAYGAKVPFLRPAEISGDRNTDYEFVKHFLDFYKKSYDHLPSLIVHLRPTTPFRKSHIVDEAIMKLESSPTYTSLRSAHASPETAYKQFEIGDDGCFVSVFYRENELDKLNEARQTYPTTYHPNGYVDVLRTDFILEHNMLHGNRVAAFITEYSHELDSPEDLEIIRAAASLEKNKNV